MKLSTKGRYGARTMLDMAQHYGQGPVLLKDIAKRQQLSKKYLEHIIAFLKAAGLVKSTRGPHGGYVLAQPPAQIKLGQVITALEGSMAPVKCVDDPKACSLAKFCPTRDIWEEMKRSTDEILESLSLQDLVERQRKKQQQQTSQDKSCRTSSKKRIAANIKGKKQDKGQRPSYSK